MAQGCSGWLGVATFSPLEAVVGLVLGWAAAARELISRPQGPGGSRDAAVAGSWAVEHLVSLGQSIGSLPVSFAHSIRSQGDGSQLPVSKTVWCRVATWGGTVPCAGWSYTLQDI